MLACPGHICCPLQPAAVGWSVIRDRWTEFSTTTRRCSERIFGDRADIPNRVGTNPFVFADTGQSIPIAFLPHSAYMFQASTRQILRPMSAPTRIVLCDDRRSVSA